MPDTLAGARNPAFNKSDMLPALMECYYPLLRGNIKGGHIENKLEGCALNRARKAS